MELKPSLSTRQQLVLSPRLYQSLKILRLSALDLQELIQRELDENPTLEIPEPSDFDSNEEPAGRELWEDLLSSQLESGAPDWQKEAPVNPTELTASPVSLADYLTLQLDLEDLSKDQKRIGLLIIGSLDEDGYLRESVEQIAQASGMPAAAVEEVLVIVQHFDPPGVAARSLEECLLLQLKQLGAGELAQRIVESFLPQVAGGAYPRIGRALAATTPQVKQAVALIRSLNPSPGSLFDTSPPAGAIVPDVYVTKVGNQMQILANREVLPPLRISRLYQQMAAALKSTDEEASKYVKAKLKDASRLIKDIDQRRTTVAKVAKAIAESQNDFFERGPDCLKPLSLDDIATKLEVHPSTISRAILGKFMSTPYGVFEFRYFFSAGYQTAGGTELAATAVKNKLSKLIAEENPGRPLSDQKLANLLKDQEITISRRTVAKYREALSIPPSWQRKKDEAI